MCVSKSGRIYSCTEKGFRLEIELESYPRENELAHTEGKLPIALPPLPIVPPRYWVWYSSVMGTEIEQGKREFVVRAVRKQEQPHRIRG